MLLGRPASLTLRLLLLGLCATPPSAAFAEDVDVCHVPPGNADQRAVIRVSPSAAERHVARHGDTLFSAVEQCNATDDDCDGRVDETFASLGERCSAGLGVCRASGSIECDPNDPSATRCDAQPREPTEPNRELTCTGGRDEDCDGLVDGDDPDCVFDPGAQLPSLVDLPITIDCCAVAGPSCPLGDYCAYSAEPPNPCPLQTGEVVSCLEFQPRPEQNACWSSFDPATRPSAVNLRAVIRNGPVLARREAVFVDNGDQIPVVFEMYDRMHGEGRYAGDPAGIDRYFEAPGIDSWVVRLPVVECQDDGDHCAGASQQELVGALCFEVREIARFPSPLVKGRFLCPDDPADVELFAECALGPDFVDP